MKTLDPLSKQILTISISLSILILSISLLIFSISVLPTAQADPPTEYSTIAPPWDEGLRGSIGLGIIDNTGYFIVYGRSGNTFYKVDLNQARDWYLD